MAQMVDYVMKVMEEMSSSEPELFQRDGSLFIASEIGFGKLNFGVNSSKFENSIIEGEGEYTKRPKFKEGEKEFIKAISYSKDCIGFTIEEVMHSAKKLSELPYGGKIRTIGHSSRYHSHKYGYAADGIDVWINEAGVMDSEEYLKLVKEEENRLFQGFEDISRNIQKETEIAIQNEERISHDYWERVYKQENIKLPRIILFTPHLRISLPEEGRFNLRAENYSAVEVWTDETFFGPDVLKYFDTEWSNYSRRNREEPSFGGYIHFNAQKFDCLNKGGTKHFRSKLTEINRQREALTSNLQMLKKNISRLDAVKKITGDCREAYESKGKIRKL